MNPSKIVCAGYCRVSSTGQVSGESLGDQEQSIINCAESKGWNISKIYIDHESGLRDDRTNFTLLKDDSGKGKFSKVLFTKLDRFGRDARDVLNNYHFFEKLNIDVVCVEQNISTSTPEGKLFRTQLSAFAEFEHSLIKSRTQRARLIKVEKRELVMAKLPFGLRWNKEKKMIESIPEEKKIYLKMVQEALQSKSPSMIADDLNLKGLKTRQGLKWDYDAVSLILRNSNYLGDFITHKFKTDSVTKKRTPQPENEWKHYKAPALIDRATWNKLQKALDERAFILKPRVDKKTDDFILRGLVRCGHCGSKLQSQYAWSYGKKYRYYQCLWSEKATLKRRRIPTRIKARCPLPIVSAPPLEETLFSEIQNFFQFPEGIIRAWKENQNVISLEPLQENFKKVSASLDKAQRRLEKFLGLYGDDLYPKDVLNKLIKGTKDSMAHIMEEKDTLQEKITSLKTKAESLNQLNGVSKTLREISGDILKAIDELRPYEKREFLIHAFGSHGLPVRILTQGDLLDSTKGIPKAELIKPVIRKENNREKIQTFIDSSWTFEGLLKGLKYLQTLGKIEFNSNTILTNLNPKQRPPIRNKGSARPRPAWIF